MELDLRNQPNSSPTERHGSAISKLMKSDIVVKSATVHRWLTVYMQGKHTDNEILYGLVVDLYRQSETLRSELERYISTFGSLPQKRIEGDAAEYKEIPFSIINMKEFCHADSDGDCEWSECPQLRDGEPKATGRHCPLDNWSVDDEC